MVFCIRAFIFNRLFKLCLPAFCLALVALLSSCQNDKTRENDLLAKLIDLHRELVSSESRYDSVATELVRANRESKGVNPELAARLKEAEFQFRLAHAKSRRMQTSIDSLIRVIGKKSTDLDEASDQYETLAAYNKAQNALYYRFLRRVMQNTTVYEQIEKDSVANRILDSIRLISGDQPGS